MTANWSEENLNLLYALLIKNGHMDSARYPFTAECSEILQAVKEGYTINYTQPLCSNNGTFTINREEHSSEFIWAF